MKNREWFERLKENEELLKSFVGSWHPAARTRTIHIKPLRITAPTAEAVCESIRREIRKESPKNPLEKWDRAVSTSDTSTLYSLLNSVWFGVPEWRGGWNIAGFAEAVELLEDPPGDGEEGEEIETREDSDPDLAF